MTKRPFWAVSLSILAMFWVTAWATDAKPMAEGIRFFQISLAIAIVIAYCHEAWQSYVKQQLGSEDLLMLGIALSWTSDAFLGLWLLLWRFGGQPSWIVNNDLVNSMLTLKAFSGVLHLVAPGAIGGVVPRRAMVRVGVAAGCACLMAFAVVSFSPRVASLLKLLRPLVEQPRNNYDAQPSKLLYRGDRAQPVQWLIR